MTTSTRFPITVSILVPSEISSPRSPQHHSPEKLNEPERVDSFFISRQGQDTPLENGSSHIFKSSDIIKWVTSTTKNGVETTATATCSAAQIFEDFKSLEGQFNSRTGHYRVTINLEQCPVPKSPSTQDISPADGTIRRLPSRLDFTFLKDKPGSCFTVSGQAHQLSRCEQFTNFLCCRSWSSIIIKRQKED